MVELFLKSDVSTLLTEATEVLLILKIFVQVNTFKYTDKSIRCHNKPQFQVSFEKMRLLQCSKTFYNADTTISGPSM